MKRLRFNKKLFALGLVLLGFCLSVVAIPKKATALSGGEFQAGRIMDDGVFFNSQTMSASNIQGFLSARVPVCDTNGTQPYAGTSRAAYSTSKGYPPPFTCLKDYAENITGRNPDSYCAGGVGGGTKTSAQIIYDVSVACGINPKVLIVLLQKEQSLVTDDWPWSIQYRSATGYGCPDTAACDSTYYGFFNQVYNAARQFRRYAIQSNLFNYRSGVTSYVQYNPNASCGGTNIYMSNQATAGLYNYTPYQPNASALNNLYGSGDSCGAYGNRNFWRMYNDWFGSTYAVPYSATYYGQSGYPSLNPGESAGSYFMYQNTGNVAWYDDSSISSAPAGSYPVHLATSHIINRASAFGTTWPSASRTAVTFTTVYNSDGVTLANDQHIAQPMQIVKFAFAITAPSGLAAATYPEYFQLVAEGTQTGAFNDLGTALLVTVNSVANLTYVGQSGYPNILPGTSSSTFLLLKNNGSAPLYDDDSIVSAPAGSYPVHLATSHPINRSSSFSGDWSSVARPSNRFSAVYNSDGVTLAGNQHVALAGQIIKFSFNFSAPAGFTANTYQEYVRPILEGTSDGYFADQGISWTITVPQTTVFLVTPTPQSLSLVSSEPGSVSFVIKNVGNTASSSNTQLTNGSPSNLYTPTWISSSIVQTLPQSLDPDESTTITVPVLAPEVSSNLVSFLGCNFVSDAITIATTSPCVVPVQVSGASYQAQTISSPSPLTLGPNQVNTLTFKYINKGNQPWYDDNSVGSSTWRNPKPTHLATTQIINRASGFSFNWPSPARPAVTFTAVYNSDGVTLASDQHIAQPGQIVKYSFTLTAPTLGLVAATYPEYFQLVAEGTQTGAFNDLGTNLLVTTK